MTALTISLDDSSWRGISARVTRVGEADGRRATRMGSRKVVVSAGRTGSTSIDVSPGEYLVEATLPTGDVVTGMCKVVGDGPVSVDIARMHAPDGTVAKTRIPRQGARDFEFPSAGGMLSTSFLGLDAHVAGMEPEVFTTPVQPRLDRSAPPDPLALAKHLPRVVRPFEPGAPDGRLRFPMASRVLAGADGTVGYEMDGQGASGAPGPVWMEFAKGTQVRKVMLPLPWLPEGETPKRLSERSRVRVDVAEDGKPRVSVDDARFGAMIGYLTTRRIAEARTALEAIADDVAVGPFPADGGLPDAAPHAYLAACYVGILEQDVRTHTWGRLAERLHRACPTSVDAMVVTARYLLVTARDTDDLTRARSLFLQASEGPPPTFTIGVQMLLDGLSAFADEDETMAARRTEFLCVARSVDTGQPFTVLSSAPSPD